MTTLSGLGAMCFMKFGIGKDLGFVLMKSIILSLLAVFTLMPGLLMSFSGLIDKTHHKNFVPKITGWGKLAVKTRYIMPPIFVLLIIAGFIFSNKCPYAFGQTDLTTARKNESQIAQERVNDRFGKVNVLAVLVPTGDYEKEVCCTPLTRSMTRTTGRSFRGWTATACRSWICSCSCMTKCRRDMSRLTRT